MRLKNYNAAQMCTGTADVHKDKCERTPEFATCFQRDNFARYIAAISGSRIYQLTVPTELGLFVRDRRMAAVHEAGHVVIARSLGVVVIRTEIWSNYSHHASFEEKCWRGRTTYMNVPSDLHHHLLISVAGAAAECCWDKEDVSASEIFDDPEGMSESDWKGTGDAPGAPSVDCIKAFEETMELLRRDGPLWNNLTREARRLIVHSREILSSP